MRRHARSLLAVVGWLAAAGAATTIGVVAVGAIGSSIAGTTISPLSQQQVDRALALSSQTASRQPTVTSPTSPGGVTRAIGTPGGTIIARCLAGKATLMSWSPAQGYEGGEIHRGPAVTAAVTFETNDTGIRVRIDCSAGVPTARISALGHGHD